MSTTSSSSFLALPDDLFLHSIFEFTPPYTLIHLGNTCRTLTALANQDQSWSTHVTKQQQADEITFGSPCLHVNFTNYAYGVGPGRNPNHNTSSTTDGYSITTTHTTIRNKHLSAPFTIKPLPIHTGTTSNKAMYRDVELRIRETLGVSALQLAVSLDKNDHWVTGLNQDAPYPRAYLATTHSAHTTFNTYHRHLLVYQGRCLQQVSVCLKALHILQTTIRLLPSHGVSRAPYAISQRITLPNCKILCTNLHTPPPPSTNEVCATTIIEGVVVALAISPAYHIKHPHAQHPHMSSQHHHQDHYNRVDWVNNKQKYAITRLHDILHDLICMSRAFEQMATYLEHAATSLDEVFEAYHNHISSQGIVDIQNDGGFSTPYLIAFTRNKEQCHVIIHQLSLAIRGLKNYLIGICPVCQARLRLRQCVI